MKTSKYLKTIAFCALMLAAAMPGKAQVSSHVHLDLPHEGGHVGFVSGSLPGRLDWMPQRLLYFFQNGH